MSSEIDRPGRWGRLAPRPRDDQSQDDKHRAGKPRDDQEWPFCGDEYPPLKGSPGSVVCTKPRHTETELHLNEETGWAWPVGQ